MSRKPIPPGKVRVPVLVTDKPRIGILLDVDLAGNQKPMILEVANVLMEIQWRRDHPDLFTLETTP